jgi:hypothetical protein
MQIVSSPTLSGPQEAALQTLQTAIVRLATKPAAKPGAQQRQELNALVEQALEAYRVYMGTTHPLS